MSTAHELHFDGLVGPTHNYAGLSPGNLLSAQHASSASSPKRAALQGLAKMRRVRDMGIPQAVLPPQPRPDLRALTQLGFTSIAHAAAEAPELLAAVYSASCMWTANAATICPSIDAPDNRLHITPANLTTLYHRCIEPAFAKRVFDAVFTNANHFAVHDPLPPAQTFSDEGAANHTRLCASHSEPGIHLFVYGRRGMRTANHNADTEPKRFPARQTLESCQALARLAGLPDDRVVYAQQHPAAIDAGVFHNDVIAVGTHTTLLHHARAFLDTPAVLDELRTKLAALPGSPALTPIEVGEHELTYEEASACYLFNSQLIATDDGLVLLAPTDTRDHARANAVADRIERDDNTIARVEYADVRESMRNGGGPACLRLRVPIAEPELNAMHQGVLLTDALHDALTDWINTHYRDELHPRDLADPSLASESTQALAELGPLLGIPALYEAAH